MLQKQDVESKCIDLVNKLDNMNGLEISSNLYNVIIKNKKIFYPKIEKYIRDNIYKYMDFIHEETLRLLNEKIIEEYDWTSGLYNCDELYFKAIIYTIKSIQEDDMNEIEKLLKSTEEYKILYK